MADDSDEKENNEETDENGDDLSMSRPSEQHGDGIELNSSSQTSSSNGDAYQTGDTAISNATKSILTSICTVFNLFFDEKYRYDYHVSLEKVMVLKKFEHEKRAVSGCYYYYNIEVFVIFERRVPVKVYEIYIFDQLSLLVISIAMRAYENNHRFSLFFFYFN